ncbi:MAG TPA: DUF3750 domain-containing protein [Pelovirga sp.]|nr:DUF3750 domain-containing protein [Pelovirga sp.]
MRRFIILSVLSLFILLNGCSDGDWRTASRQPAGIAPDPANNREAVVQIYAARAWGWRGWFAVHTWIATKGMDEPHYTVYEVIGWRGNRGLPVLRVEADVPDRYWYGKKPRLLADYRGSEVDSLIAQIQAAAHNYPWPNEYRVFPGPNSNTFTGWVLDQVPALDVRLPFAAIGSGYSR